jgi:hypothetical protein
MLALQAMRAAYSGIQYCCDCLREGTVEIQRVKKTVEGGVADAKKLYTEVTGIWGWIKSLLGGAPAKRDGSAGAEQPAPTAVKEAPVEKSKKKKRDDGYVDHIPTQDEVVQQFIGHMGEWFEKYAYLKAFTEKRYAEVFGKDEINSKEVLELTQLQAELDAAYPTLSTLMSGAPWQLGPIWSQFKEMQDKVKAGQAARQLKAKREKAWQEARAEKARHDRIDRNVTVFFTVLGVAYFWLLIGIVANV